MDEYNFIPEVISETSVKDGLEQFVHNETDRTSETNEADMLSSDMADKTKEVPTKEEREMNAKKKKTDKRDMKLQEK